MSNGGVMLTGWLRKSPPERKLRRNAWKKRWFVLRSGRLSGDPNVLEYFRHQGSKKPIRAISLNECSQIDANVPIKYEKKDPLHQYVFDIVTKTRTYYLVADTSLEMASWVRYLCDLCGFNHDSPESQADLGSQQQTFKAVQSIPGRSYPPGAQEPLLGDANGTPVSGEVPMPLPRPQNTITKKSVPIPGDPVDANGNFRNQGKSLVEGSTSGTSSGGSGRVSVAGTPNHPRKFATGEKNGYAFAVDPSLQQANSSEYVLLTDCNTAPACEDPPEEAALSAGKFNERRASTDSVFTHEGAISDCASDVVLEQPTSSSMALRFVTGGKTSRLNSMPDCPPPPPPNQVAGHKRLGNDMTDDLGYSYPPDEEDEDDVREARTRSVRSPGYSFPPIDDSEIKRVPLNLQHEYRVDEMGLPLNDDNRLSSGSSVSARYPVEHSSAGTEYINTADASSEVGIGSYPAAHAPSRFNQHYPVPGKPFLSPISRATSSQMSPSPVFFSNNQPAPISSDPSYSFPRQQPQIYDFPKSRNQQQHYSSPRHAQLYNSKNSLYSSASTLAAPYSGHGSPQRATNVLPFVPNSGGPRIRRSSSVGQLETVANELAAKTNDQTTPTHMRRRSIDHRRPNIIYNVPSTPQSIDMGMYSGPSHFGGGYGYPREFPGRTRPKTPPPRPPKSEATVKQSMNSNQVAPWPPQSSHSQHLERISSESTSTDRGDPQAPNSPAHTAVFSTDTPDSPQHTQVLCITNDGLEEVHNVENSPVHTPVRSTQPATTTSSRISPNHTEVISRSISSSCSSSSGANSTDTSRSRSPVSAIYDIPKSRGHSGASDAGPGRLAEVNDPASVYDTPRPKGPAGAEGNLGARRLAEIEDTKHPSYEPMMNQTEPIVLEKIDDTSQYTSMAGATTLMNHSPIPSLSKSSTPHLSRQAAVSEPPPVKRDLKPGRRSLGSDGGGDTRSFHSRVSGDDSTSTSGEVGSPGSQTHFSDGPVSPPHVMLMHSTSSNTQQQQQQPPQPSPVPSSASTPRGYGTMPSTPHTLYPPERPPKSSQSSLSPRTPPSASMALGRPYAMPYSAERGHKQMFDSATSPSPTMHPRHKVSGSGVPGRPPKPINMMQAAASPVPGASAAWDDGAFVTGRPPAPMRPPKSKFSNDLDSPHFGTVPPPSHHPDKQVKYVELTGFSQTTDSAQRSDSAPLERHPKEDGVQYIVIDTTRTKALQIMKEEREKEQQFMQKRPVDAKSAKTLK